ncbi:Fe(3+)-hydroxamate ABC transporter permease FhuB [Bacillus sp. FSL W7-1321]
MNEQGKSVFYSFFLLIIGLSLLLVISGLHLTQGQAPFTLKELVLGLWEGDGRIQSVVFGIRMPRVAVGLLAGGALAMAGLVLQTLTKNPLASAGTLGINAGAYFMVVAAAVFFPGLNSSYPFIASFLGSAFAALLVFSLAGRAMDPVRVALTGMIVSLLFAAVTSGLQLMFEQETNGLFLWGAGTLIQNDWSGFRFALPFIVCAGLLLLLLGKQFDLLLLGEEAAAGLGASIQRIKAAGWLLAIMLAAATVSVAGPIGFIGLMAPHIVRMLGIRGHLQQLIHAFVWGAFLLIAADVLARFIQPGSEIPVGAITALIGGPWLMYLAYRTGKRYKGQNQTLRGNRSKLSFPWLITSMVAALLVVAIGALAFGGGSFYSFSEMVSGALFDTVTVQFRWPRVLVAFLVGSLLALCGVLLQSVLRNPLGDPSILGITSGGGVGALSVIVLFPSLSFVWVPVGAATGAGLAIAIILLATKRSNWEPISLALMGVAVSAMGSGIIQILTVKAGVGVAPVLLWLAGSTYGMNWQDVWFLAFVLIALVPISYSFSRQLDVLALNQEVSVTLGLRIQLVRVLVLLLAVGAGAAAVAVAGAISFIGLLAPHAARGIVGVKTRFVVPVSMLLGGILLVTADLLGRLVLYPKDIPSGLLVAIIGAPYLLYIMKKL